ncbi:caspase family protein [Streptomyces sp. NPDC047061]|uniref:caspase, EACC1-associated type n=1 Tax=Streptomyces sp. NPDC047061 TaxID=3154605 RepID=UPI0033CB58B0
MGRRLALLIATYDYQDTGLQQLTAPAHDAEALAAVLRNPDIAGFEVTTLVNEPHHLVGEAIGDFYRDRRRDDLALLYFTGHGLKDDDGRLYLAMTNTRRDSLLFTALSAEQIDQAMSGCMSRQKVLILDCCYSGAFPAGRLAKGDTAVHALERFQGRGRTVLTASDATQYSFEGNQPRGQAVQSVFTRHLVAGLRDGSADLDGDGDITLDELYSYVHDRVVDEMPQQRPKKQDNVEGRIVIARNINWTLPTHLRNALRSPIADDRLASLDGLAHLHRIGNDTVRNQTLEEIHRLTGDDSRLVSAAAIARLQSILPHHPDLPHESPGGAAPDAAESVTKTTTPVLRPSPAPPPQPGSQGLATTPAGSSSSPVVQPTSTIGQLPPVSPTAPPPDTPGRSKPDVTLPAARPTEPGLPASTGLAPTTSAAIPATSGTAPHAADQQQATQSPSAKHPPTRYLARRRLLLTLGAIGLSTTATYLLVGDTSAVAYTLTGNNRYVRSVTFSPDGKILAAGSFDHTVRLWDVATRKQLGTLTDRSFLVNSVAFSPNGKTLAAGGNLEIRLWDIATRNLLGPPLTGSGDVPMVAFSPDGKILASTSYNQGSPVRLWDVATRKQLSPPLAAGSKGVTTVAFSPDGKTLASGGEGGTVRLWDVATRKQLGTLTDRSLWVNSVAFSPDGKTLASANSDEEGGTVRLWDVATRKQLSPPLAAGSKGVTTVAFSPDGMTLASGGGDSAVRLWDVATRKQLRPPLTGHSKGVNSVAFSPDGKTLASGGNDGTVRLWRVTSSY